MLTKNLLTLLLCAPIHGVCMLALRARCPVLRSGSAVGAHPAAGALRELAIVEGEQLFAAGAGLPDRDGRRRATRSRSFIRIGRHRHAGLRRDAALRRELSAAERIPYARMWRRPWCGPQFGDYCRHSGWAARASRARDDAELNNWHERLNVLWRNIASPSVALWTHVVAGARRIGRPAHEAPHAARELFAESPACALSATPRRRDADAQRTLSRRALSAGGGIGDRLVSRASLRERSARAWRAELADALDACDKLAQTFVASLARYEPELLGCYRHGSVVFLAARVSRRCWSTASGSACRCRAGP